MKSAAVFERGRLYFHPYSRTVQGFWIFVPPVTELALSSDSIGQALLETLSYSQTEVAHPASWTNLIAPLLEAASVKSFDALAKGARCVEARLEGGVLELVPTKNGGKGHRFVHLNEKIVRCRAQHAAVTVALRQALERCE